MIAIDSSKDYEIYIENKGFCVPMDNDSIMLEVTTDESTQTFDITEEYPVNARFIRTEHTPKDVDSMSGQVHFRYNDGDADRIRSSKILQYNFRKVIER